MFEEVTGFRVRMIIADSRGYLVVETNSGDKFMIKQVGPDLEVIKCS